MPATASPTLLLVGLLLGHSGVAAERAGVPIAPRRYVAVGDFASNDRSTVNQNFGAAEGLAVYALDGERAQLAEIVEFPPAAMAANEGRLAARGARGASLTGCAAVYCLVADASAVEPLLAVSLQPIRLDDAAAIDVLLQQLKRATAPASIACLTKAGTNDAGHPRSPWSGGRRARRRGRRSVWGPLFLV